MKIRLLNHSRACVFRACVLALLSLALVGCDKPQAFGEPSSIIVGAADPVWDRAGELVMSTLEPRVLTVRDERTLRLTRLSPLSPDWSRLRRFRQVLVIGTATDPWVETALERVRGNPDLTPPAILQAFDVWANSQLVTILLLPEGEPTGPAVQTVLEELRDLMDQQYRQFVRARMYVSGRDSTVIRHIEEEAGFHLDIPRVYRWAVSDSVVRYRNDNPTPAELIREVAVTWTHPDNVAALDSATTLAWRQALAEEYYIDDQELELRNSEFQVTTFPGGYPGFQARASWSSPPGSWPAAGPLIARTLTCPEFPDRVFLLDGWLYAPGVDKYEYILQLENIMDSFRCVG
jgi:hypothetical protein